MGCINKKGYLGSGVWVKVKSGCLEMMMILGFMIFFIIDFSITSLTGMIDTI